MRNNLRNHHIVTFLVGIIVVAAVLLWPGKAETPSRPAGASSDAYKNATYEIDGRQVTLVNGIASRVDATPGSASQTMTQYLGDGSTGDLNGDGISDTGFIITQSGGGSGTFFYAVAALKTPTGYQGTSAVLLGDRIAPQSTSIDNGQLIVNYADRAPGEPMTAQPSVGVTKRLILSGTTLTEVKPLSGEGEHCGGNMATAASCASGLHCAPTPGSHLPMGDVGGTCVAN